MSVAPPWGGQQYNYPDYYQRQQAIRRRAMQLMPRRGGGWGGPDEGAEIPLPAGEPGVSGMPTADPSMYRGGPFADVQPEIPESWLGPAGSVAGRQDPVLRDLALAVSNGSMTMAQAGAVWRRYKFQSAPAPPAGPSPMGMEPGGQLR